ncbi:MAG: M24 family metallopeptidase [Acidobacteriota bacterium]|nr:M24 family metallopeptidase [Acidobacteriota bacterium]MDQ3168952.1 M24 family metallopeptidase [Acidobacteriota bacterium]
MAIDIKGIQAALAREGLDGWLLYDFHGSNQIATRITGLDRAGKMTTRRWYYMIPASGEPRALVHAIERYNLDSLPGSKQLYAGRKALESGLAGILGGARRIAMEYSAECAIPYLARVDAGTIELIRRSGVEIVSSGDLVQEFEAAWDAAAIETHKAASDALYRIKDKAFALVAARLGRGERTTEYDVQSAMLTWFAEEGLIAADEPNVSAQENAGDPHYQPNATKHREIRKDEMLLIDLWGKLDKPGAVYADITWVAYTGTTVPGEYVKAFKAIADGRDAAVALVEQAAREGRELRGFEVDRACRDVIDRAGYGDKFVHRTGHSLGEHVHGNGVHMDDYETHDDRRLIPGTGFTIEPGVYTDTFGVRTEVNMVVGARDASVTGPRQQQIVTLG